MKNGWKSWINVEGGFIKGQFLNELKISLGTFVFVSSSLQQDHFTENAKKLFKKARVSTKYHISTKKKISSACCDPAPDFYCSFTTTSFTYGGKNEFPVQTHWAPHIHTCSDTLRLNEVECLALLKAPAWHDRALVSAEDYGVRNKHTNRSSETNGRSLLFCSQRQAAHCCLLICYWPGRGRGSSGAKVIRPKRSSCLGGVGPAAVNATLLPPLSLIKNEWWAVWVKGVNGGGLCPGGVQRGSLWLSCWTRHRPLYTAPRSQLREQ